MRLSPHRTTTAAALLIAALLLPAATPGDPSDPPALKDPLAEEIARWNAFLRSNPGSGEIWDDVRQGSGPALARAETALRDGRPLLALHRLAAAREGLAAAAYLLSRTPEQRKDTALFESEWRRMGDALREDLRPPAAPALESMRPAAVRAIGEAALQQVRVYYEASLEYGRNTILDAGLYYLGSAQAQRDLAAFLRSLPAPPSVTPPPLRALGPELDALEAELLAAYRPPASIDRHTEFIRASGALKEARELDAAGLHYGALLRYLQAVQRLAPLSPSSSASTLEETLRSFDARLSARGADHTIGRLFLETAQALGGTGKDADPAAVQAIADDVLPRYFAALEPARPQAVRPAPRVTVTLVRWPYT